MGAKIKYVALMAVSFVLLALAIMFLSESVMSALFFFLAALVANPIFLKRLGSTNTRLPGYVFAIITAILFYLGCSFLPSTLAGNTLEKAVEASMEQNGSN